MSQKPYPQYKESGVRWLGEIPSDWALLPLWSLFRRNKSLGTGSEELLSVYRDYGVIPKASRNDNFNKESDDLSKYQLVEVGDLVINKMKAWQGSVAISGYNGIVSPAYFVFKSLADMNLRFMHYLMRSTPYYQHYASISAGVRPNQWDLDPSRHRAMPVLFPPPGEQQEIADFLDIETAEIDAFITEQEELIALLGERRTATITRAVTKGLTPGTRMKDSGVPWLGEVPAHWALSKLGHHYEVVLGKMLDGAKEAPIGARVLPYIRAGNIQDSGLDLSDVNEMAYTPYEAERLDLIAKDLLVVEGGSVGTVHYLDSAMGGWSFQKTVNRVRSLGSADTKYLGNLIRTFRDSGVFEVICNGSTIMHLTAEKLRALTIPVPTVDEQRSIAVFIDRETEEIDAAIEEARIAIALSKERRAAVISAAVTGKIDVRDIASRTSTNKVGAEPVGVA